MMRDPYEILGLDKSATQKDIKDAFKKLTRKHHPDLHPDDPKAAEKFSEISAANDLLGDPGTRRRFDAGEIDASGAERPQQQYYRDYAGGPGAGAYRWSGDSHAWQDGFGQEDDLEEFLRQAFGGAAGTRRRHEMRARGPDVSYTLTVGFLEAATGATRTVTLPDGKTLKLTIPEGAHDRQTLRLKGQGGAGYGGGPAGDAYVEIHVEPHAFFHRKDNNIHVDVPVTLKEAVLGAKIKVPTISGAVTLTVPPGSNTGKVLRLREQGILDRKSGRRGHQYVTLKVELPEGDEPELVEFLRNWTPRTQQNPRKEMV